MNLQNPERIAAFHTYLDGDDEYLARLKETDRYSYMLNAYCAGYEDRMIEENGIRDTKKITLVLQVEVSDPEESKETPGLFVTKLTHPELAGELALAHGKDRAKILGSVAVDPKELNPVGELFKHLRELRRP